MSETVKVLIKEINWDNVKSGGFGSFVLDHVYDEETGGALCCKTIVPTTNRSGTWVIEEHALEKWETSSRRCVRCMWKRARQQQQRKRKKPRIGWEWLKAESDLNSMQIWFDKIEPPERVKVYGNLVLAAEVRRRCNEYREAMAAWEAEQEREAEQ